MSKIGDFIANTPEIRNLSDQLTVLVATVQDTNRRIRAIEAQLAKGRDAP